MKESKGFTLVELMIVVAIIGILAAVAVPFYQRYIQKSRMTSKVWPGVHSIETNLATYYSFHGTLPTSNNTQNLLFSDASTFCFSPSIQSGALQVVLANVSSKTCNLAGLAAQASTITATPQYENVSGATKITGWRLTGNLALVLGLENEQ